MSKELLVGIAHAHYLLVVSNQLLVLIAPRIGAAAIRVGTAVHTCLITIEEGRHARIAQNECCGQLQPCLAQLIVKVLQGSLRYRLLTAAELVDGTDGIMGIHDVHQVIKCLPRIILLENFQLVICRLGIAPVQEQIAYGKGQLVVHNGVKLVTGQELGTILPDFTQQQRLLALGGLDLLYSLADIAPELSRNLLGHIKAPAGQAILEPLGDYGIVPIEEILTQA